MMVPAWFPGPASDHKHQTDFGTESGARRLCEMIMQRWRACGHGDVIAWPERLPQPGPRIEKVRFAVRTNLINGLPPSAFARRLAA